MSWFTMLLTFFAFAAMGGFLVLHPELLTRLTGLELSTVEARNETRSVYGGIGIGFALAVLIAMMWSPWRQGVAWTMGLTLLAMAAARGYSAFLERPKPMIWGFLAAEAILGLMLVIFVV